MIIQVIAAFFATIFFSILFNVNRKQLLYCGIVGALGWAMYLFTFSITHSTIASSLTGSLIVSIISNIMAIRRKAPVTTFQISGIIPLVPGAGMYRTAFNFINDNFELANIYLVETLSIAGAIALAMLSVYTFMGAIKRVQEIMHTS